MNLDYKFYEKIIPSKYLNKEYILVNKYYYVGEKYVPENLESLPLSYSRSGMKLTNVAKSALEELINAAKTDNMTILVTSSYRSYEYQVKLYNQYAEENSKEEADNIVNEISLQYRNRPDLIVCIGDMGLVFFQSLLRMPGRSAFRLYRAQTG